MTNDKKENKGWTCPRCGASNAPHLSQCPSCKPKEVKEEKSDNKELLLG